MNCRETEDLLPRYVEGDLSPGEEQLVRIHLETCARCRQSYAVFARLEQALKGLKGELPPPSLVTETVMRRVRGSAGRRRFSPATIWSFPAVASFLLVMATIIILTYRESVSKLAEAVGSGYIGAMERFAEDLPRWIIQASGGETWVLATALVLCILLMILSGGYAAIRYASK
jgi:predicted anti-sigma-YlaC factor YlaD